MAGDAGGGRGEKELEEYESERIHTRTNTHTRIYIYIYRAYTRSYYVNESINRLKKEISSCKK